jgi:hypothetical protein
MWRRFSCEWSCGDGALDSGVWKPLHEPGVDERRLPVVLDMKPVAVSGDRHDDRATVQAADDIASDHMRRSPDVQAIRGDADRAETPPRRSCLGPVDGSSQIARRPWQRR